MQKVYVICVLVSLLTACSATQSGAKVGSSEIPSKIDPKNPPTLEVTGMSPGSFVESAKNLEIVVKSKNVVESGLKTSVFVNGELFKTLNSSEEKVNLQSSVKEGLNTVALSAVMPDGSFVKHPESFKYVNFVFKKKPESKMETSLSPVLISSPRGVYSGDNRFKILFDYIFKPQGTLPKIYYSLNGETRELQGWGPHYFQNLSSGIYKLKVWEVDKNGKSIGAESQVEFSVQ